MKLQRFTLTERLFHWAFAIPMLLLAGSGTLMVLASIGIVTAFPKESLLFFHTLMGFSLIILPALAYLQGDRAVIRQNIQQFFNFTSSDRCWLFMNFISLIKSEAELPLEGKFNGGQKVNALLMMAFTFTLCTSGIIMLAVKGALVANIFHFFTFSLFAMLFSGHLYLATIHRATRPAFMGIINGYVEAHWLEQHHFLMFQELKGTIFDDIVVDHAKKNELKMIYDRVYKNVLSSPEFTRLCRRSEAMLVARRNDVPVAFMQVVGDGCLHGYIAKSATFASTADHNDFFSKFRIAAEAVIRHALLRP